MRVFWKRAADDDCRRGFDFYDDLLIPFTKRFSHFKWLVEGSVFGWAWWYALTHPWKLVEGMWDQTKYAYQRMTKGYDKPATYNTSHHLATHIPALLRELKAWGNSYPCGIAGHGIVVMDEDVGENVDKDVGENVDKDDGDIDNSSGDDVPPENQGLKAWHATLDEIILGFESAERLISRDSPVWDELHAEWEKRFHNTEPYYFDYENATDSGVEWKTLPEYDALIDELKLWEREKKWRDEQMMLFHRGMILFHQHFMDLWD